MFNPLSQFITPQVKDLLTQFYTVNFVRHGVAASLASEIVQYTWDHRQDDMDKVKPYLNSCFERTTNKYIKKTTGKYPPLNTSPAFPILELLQLENVNTLVDFGTTRLLTLKQIATLFPNITKLIGMDINPLQVDLKLYPSSISYMQLKRDHTEIPLADNSVDVVQTKFVLHHLESDHKIRETLQEFQRILRPQGRVIVWEETCDSELSLDQITQLADFAHAHQIPTDIELTTQFYQLSQKQRFEFIIINDWIINANNDFMPWAPQYKLAEEWIKLFQDSNFVLTRNYNFGLLNSGKIKQGINYVLEFTKV